MKAATAAGDRMGEETDWRRWLREHGPSLVLLARQWTGQAADAQDAVQEAFVRFWKSGVSAADPTAYMYACVRRYCLEWHRQRNRRQRREWEMAQPEIVVDAFFDRIEQDERRLAIEAALRALPIEQREVVMMRIWSGLSFPQIGSALSISVDTAASRYRYAMEKLRRKLAAEVEP